MEDLPAPPSPLKARRIVSIQTGAAVTIAAQGSAEWWDKEWSTGFYKAPRTGLLWLGYEGLSGDEQADRRNHGGVDKAVCVYPIEHYGYWREKLAPLDLPHGAFGENFTTAGMLEAEVCVGDIYTVGSAVVQVSQPREPCWKVARRWRIKDLTAQVERTGRTGFYFRVVRHGEVQAGDALALRERPAPQWSIERCNEAMHRRKEDEALARELADCSLLAASWKDALWTRAEALAKRGAPSTA
jgi:MOSC domain-containing protein YiiM